MTGPERMKSPAVVLSELSPRTLLPVAVIGFVAVVGLLMTPCRCSGVSIAGAGFACATFRGAGVRD